MHSFWKSLKFVVWERVKCGYNDEIYAFQKVLLLRIFMIWGFYGKKLN